MPDMMILRDKGMTPFQIHILLHYYTNADDYGDKWDSSLLKTTLEGFVRDGLLRKMGPEEKPNPCNAVYAGTAKLKAYAVALCSVPIPRQVWVVDPIVPVFADADSA